MKTFFSCELLSGLHDCELLPLTVSKTILTCRSGR